jgi:hypothetical protein
MKAHGIRVNKIRHEEPGATLPRWVREAAIQRGYGDALEPLSLFVTEKDINAAFACRGQGNGSKCVMAQAGTRLGAEHVWFYRTTAWVDFGAGPILRFKIPKIVYDNIITPFDDGDRNSVLAGMYPLLPPSGSQTLTRRREYDRNERPRERGQGNGSIKRHVSAHNERVILAHHQ